MITELAFCTLNLQGDKDIVKVLNFLSGVILAERMLNFIVA
jgi:hypothetical protein